MSRLKDSTVRLKDSTAEEGVLTDALNTLRYNHGDERFAVVAGTLSDRSDVKEEYDIRYILTLLLQSFSLTITNTITPMNQKRPSFNQPID